MQTHSTRTPNFVQTRSGRAAIDDATRLARPWVANRALSNGLRALAHELYRQDPSQDRIALDTPAQAEALYALVKAAAREAEGTEHKGALTPEGLPVGADGLARLSGPGDAAQSLGRYWLKAVDYATAQNLTFEDAPSSRSIPVSVGPRFREHLHALLLADAEGAVAKNPDLATKAARAQELTENRFLRGGRQLRHGGVFPLPSKKVSELSPRQLETLTRRKEGALIGAAFGFGQVFGGQTRHGAGWGC